MTEHVGLGGGRVLAVLGYSGSRGARLHPVCAERLAHAERLAIGARAIILSGWARRSGSPEAELMRAAWAGPAVRLICDPEARSTSDNAVNIAAAVRALGAEELVVVTSPWHRARAHVLLRAAMRGSGVRLSVVAEGRSRPPLLLARELVCLALLPFQLARLGTRKASAPARFQPASRNR
jgi:uncharacterized SAM-binding protein YcdF (DUF218 family)